jgi:eukaryotic-like serine/threonine-protein kinase
MLAAGQILGHYRIEERLGEGAFGEVWRGVDVRLDRKVALKAMRAGADEDPEAWGRLLEEARAASALNHPAICATYDVGEEDGTGYIAMEYVEGRALSDLVRSGTLTPALAVSYGVDMTAALAHAHGRGIIHRDLKASNVMITPEGHAKLLDFGLARRLNAPVLESLTQSRESLASLGGAAGTLCYMAPELLRGKPASIRSDLWSLGALLFETLSGRLPFQGQTPFELSMAIMVEEPPALDRALPAALRNAVRRCLEKDPVRRPTGAGEVQTVLEQSKAALAAAARNHSARRTRSRRAAASLIALLALGGLSFAWWHLRAGRRPAATITVVRKPAAPAPLTSAVAPSSTAATSPAGARTGQTLSRRTTPTPDAAGHARTAGNPNTDVWVNLKTKVYHCPGTRWYKQTASGRLMKQRQAELAGYHAASSKACE